MAQSKREAELSIVRGQRGTPEELRHDLNAINNLVHLYSDACQIIHRNESLSILSDNSLSYYNYLDVHPSWRRSVAGACLGGEAHPCHSSSFDRTM